MKISLPNTCYVPKQLSDKQLIGSAEFRTHGKFPILTYYNQENGIAIWRSSMPFSQSLRNKLDEQVLSSLQRSHQKLYIFNPYSVQQIEERSILIEKDPLYKNIKHVHYLLGDPSFVGKQFLKLWKYSNKRDGKYQKNFLTKLAKTEWLTNIDNMLKSAFLI